MSSSSDSSAPVSVEASAEQPFSSLALRPELLQALEALQYLQMTPIQAQSLPVMLAGHDVIGQARTGSGKTAAYALALLSRIDPALRQVQALVLCPTRELADQIAGEIRRLARMLPNIKLSVLGGGISLRPQIASLEHEPHIVVGMPGRVQEHLAQGTLKLGGLRVLVLDEADRMLDGDFEQASREIVDQAPKDRQTLFFSATYAYAVREISTRLQSNPQTISVDEEASPPPGIDQQFFEVEGARRLDALAYLLSEHKPASALVFCHTRKDAQEIETTLRKRGYAVLALHGDIEQRERDEVLVRFVNGSARVLVATDVAARGLDIPELAAVISYELPKAADTHLHRIGRTGRAGRSGLALHLYTPVERGRFTAIQQHIGEPLRAGKLNLPPRIQDRPLAALRATLCIDAGRRDKLRPGDVLGALTGAAGLPADAVGKISSFDTRTYVAVTRSLRPLAFQRLRDNKIKNRNFRVRLID